MRKSTLTVLALAGLTLGACGYSTGDRALSGGALGGLAGAGIGSLSGNAGTGALIGAGALIAENKDIPPGALVMGAPGKVVRMLDEAALEGLRQSAARYRANAARFRTGLRQVR